MLAMKNTDIKGKTVAISGFGNVAWGAALKANELGAKVVTISGPDGYIYDPDGISGEKVDYMLYLRSTGEDIVAPYAEKYPGYHILSRPETLGAESGHRSPLRHTERACRRGCPSAR